MASANSSASLAPPRIPAFWAAMLLFVAIGLAYANSLNTPFLFDDAGAVVGNPTIRRLWSLDVLRPPSDGSTTTGRPLVNLSFAINFAVSGDHVWSYHLGNVAVHAGAALLLFGLVRRTLLTFKSSTINASGSAIVIALIWALHPLQTESVVCIAQRTEILCGFFYLLTLYGFLRAAQTSNHGAMRFRWSWGCISVAACFAGMMTKEVMVTAPLVVFLFDRTFLAETFSRAWIARRNYYVALAVTWLVLLLLLRQSGGSRGVAAGFDLGVSPWTYLLKQCDALEVYLRLAFWPHPLVLDYGTGVVRSATEVVWQGLVVLALLGATIWALGRRPALGFLGAAFFLLLAPSSSVVPLVTQTMAEHRMYLALAALVSGAVVAVQLVRPPGRMAVLSALALGLGFTTHARNRDYRDPLTIWSVTVADYPQSARAHNNLALVLQTSGQGAKAHAHFARAVELDPGYATGHYNWGVALLNDGRLEEAVARFESAIRLAPRHTDALVNLGTALVRLQRPADAIAYYERALHLQPRDDVHYNLGVALADAGRGTEAAEHFHAALRLNPRLPEAHFQLARWHERERRTADAEQHLVAVLQLAPAHAGAHARLGLLYARADRLDDASRHLREAARLSPSDADVLANLGNVLLLQGNARDALGQYEQALRLRPNDARLQESLRSARDALH